MRAELKIAGYKLTGGGVTYAATYEGAQKVLALSPQPIDFELHAKMATTAAGYATAIYFSLMAGHVAWKWFREWRASRRKP